MTVILAGRKRPAGKFLGFVCAKIAAVIMMKNMDEELVGIRRDFYKYVRVTIENLVFENKLEIGDEISKEVVIERFGKEILAAKQVLGDDILADVEDDCGEFLRSAGFFEEEGGVVILREIDYYGWVIFEAEGSFYGVKTNKEDSFRMGDIVQLKKMIDDFRRKGY